MQNTNDTIRTASFALYRLPHESTCHAIRTEPKELSGPGTLTGHTGFILAPSATSAGLPTLFFEGEPESRPMPQALPTSGLHAPSAPMTDEYRSDFLHLHGELTAGRLRKVVLARSRTISMSGHAPALQIFANACAAYPSAFVALVRTPRHGTWIMATPELLVESHGGRLRTVALAGTMRKADTAKQWSAKNRDEQGVVSRYVRQSISPLAQECECGATETITSGHLLHLMTTFRFTLRPGATALDVATALHPTPAVCGMPKEAALQALSATEHCRREYYSGFAGPLSANGDADLYVTLRCAKMDGDKCTLFAGGGLMPESRAADEWDETEAKMATIMSLL